MEAQDRLRSEDTQNSGLRRGKMGRNPVVLSVLLVVAILGAMLAWASFRTGSVGAALAYLGGRTVYASPQKLVLSGSGSGAREVTLLNLSDRPIQVVGYNATCSCVKISGLPLKLGPRAVQSVSVRAVSSVNADVPVMFVSDNAEQGTVQISVKVRGASPAGEENQ